MLVVALALALAVGGFLPFNLRPGRGALTWMGDSGSQLIGFTLASLGLASSYTVATSTVATLVLPVLVLAVPILDTTLVTIVRLLDGRPVSQGGRDHSSHRLVSLGVSETNAVVLLALVSAALGGNEPRLRGVRQRAVAAIGVLITFALLVQFGSVLADVDRGARAGARSSLYLRRLGEVVVDGALISASFLAAYLLRFDGIGTPNQRHYFLLTLPVLLFCRYVALLLLGMYAGVWRYASSRDALRGAVAVVVSAVVALGIVVLTQGSLGDFSRSVFVIDAFICTMAIMGARFAERAIVRGIQLARLRDGRRVLIVGAGRTGRSLLRELRETPGERVVGFVDDDPGLRGRRLNGVRVLAGTTSLDAVLERAQPDLVFVTIPNAPRERLDEIVAVVCRAVDRVQLRSTRGRHRPARHPRHGTRLSAPRRTVLDRLLAAYPLIVAYLVLLTLYAWQTTRVPSPWIFTDELQWSLLSRGIAHTGRAQLRLHDAGFGSLYAYLIAPAWWAATTKGGYAAAKYLNAVTMAASIFPAYLLARLFVARSSALLVALATATIPSLALTGVLMPESLAYTWSALALWLTARALLRPTRWTVALAVVSVVIAPARSRAARGSDRCRARRVRHCRGNERSGTCRRAQLDALRARRCARTCARHRDGG